MEKTSLTLYMAAKTALNIAIIQVSVAGLLSVLPSPAGSVTVYPTRTSAQRQGLQGW